MQQRTGTREDASAKLAPLLWPLEQLDAAFLALSRQSRLLHKSEELPPLPSDMSMDKAAAWLDAAASQVELEVQGNFTRYKGVERSLRGIGPAILIAPAPLEGFLLALRGNGRWLWLLDPALERRKLPLAEVASAFCAPFDRSFRPGIEQLLDAAGIPAARRPKATQALLIKQAGNHKVGLGWSLRLAQHAPSIRGLLHSRVPRYCAGILVAQAVRYCLMLGSWWLLGQSVFSGRFAPGWMLAWFLLLLSMLPFTLMSSWWQGLMALEAGSFLKQKLLSGALRLPPDDISTKGKGHWLAQVIESDAVETLLFNGGFVSLISLVELSFAAVIMSMGSGGGLRLALFALWCLLCLGLLWHNVRLLLRWTDERIALTNDLVERMVGHRTRIAQESRERWHQGEDQAAESYLQQMAKMDRSGVWLGAMIPRGWLLLGLISLLPTFLAGQASVYQLAIGLGGVLLAYQALYSFIDGLTSLNGAWIAWRKVAPLFQAASEPLTVASPYALHVQEASDDPNDAAPLLEATDLSFRYNERTPLILHRCQLSLKHGDRILLEGPSGGGKSTLANLLLGMREPSAGLLLLDGFDQQTLGARGWQQRITAAPQFHENHVLTHTFAFNLLMGRRWPPSQEDLRLAHEICLELGLGPLLEKMPGGLSQMVGESGWQLSHGEKSRLFIARALLQESDLIILDESFGALDPETLQRALDCVLKRARALIVIAHP